MATQAGQTSVKSAFDKIAKSTQGATTAKDDQEADEKRSAKMSKETQEALKRINERPPLENMNDPVAMIVRMFRTGLDFAKVLGEVSPGPMFGSKTKIAKALGAVVDTVRSGTVTRTGLRALQQTFSPLQWARKKLGLNTYADATEKMAKDAEISVNDKGVLTAYPRIDGKVPDASVQEDFQAIVHDYLRINGYQFEKDQDGSVKVLKNGNPATQKEISDTLRGSDPKDGRGDFKKYLGGLSRLNEKIAQAVDQTTNTPLTPGPTVPPSGP